MSKFKAVYWLVILSYKHAVFRLNSVIFFEPRWDMVFVNGEFLTNNLKTLETKKMFEIKYIFLTKNLRFSGA